MRDLKPGRLAIFVGANVAVVAVTAITLATFGSFVVASQQEGLASATRRLAVERALARRNAAVLTLDPARIQDLSSRFIRGETASIQSANLLTLLKTVADRHAVTFTSVSVLPNLDWQGGSLIGARIEFTADNDRVAAIVSAIEQGHAPLVIPRMQLRATGEQLSQAEQIAANLDVYGLARWPGG